MRLIEAIQAAAAACAGGVTIGVGNCTTLGELDVTVADVLGELLAGVADAVEGTVELGRGGATDCRWVPVELQLASTVARTATAVTAPTSIREGRNRYPLHSVRTGVGHNIHRRYDSSKGGRREIFRCPGFDVGSRMPDERRRSPS
jgi:hypothetical protein